MNNDDLQAQLANSSQVQPVAQIIIQLMPNGALAVNGNIENKLMAYGMLETAKDSIGEYHQQQQRRVQPVGIIPGMNLKGGG